VESMITTRLPTRIAQAIVAPLALNFIVVGISPRMRLWVVYAHICLFSVSFVVANENTPSE